MQISFFKSVANPIRALWLSFKRNHPGHSFFVIAITIVIASCATSKTWVSDDATLAELPESAPQFRLFLIGDQGE
ncbi:MAG: hypothetical protein LC664_08605, partial [Flavobacteriales bacterium]|nr:hypothetical protein [Flavobacteriales bacterium]